MCSKRSMRAGIRWLRTSSRAWVEEGDEDQELSVTEEVEEAEGVEK